MMIDNDGGNFLPIMISMMTQAGSLHDLKSKWVGEPDYDDDTDPLDLALVEPLSWGDHWINL